MSGPYSHADVSGDGAVKASGGVVIAVLLTAGAAAAGTLILYDNPSAASGTVLCSLSAVTSTSVQWTPPGGQVAATGIYADIGGTGANATVVYR